MSVLFNFCHNSDYNMQTFKMLVDAGADITYMQPGDNLTLLHIMYHPRSHEMQDDAIKITAIYSESRPHLVKTLLDNGVSIKAQNKLGDTPLHIFIDRNPYHKEEVYEILSLLKNNDGLTPLLIAAKQSNLKIIKYLLDECDANSNEADTDGNNALHIAIKRNYYDMVHLLLNRGIAITANHDGQTPLHVAVTNDAMQLIPIIFFLLNKGIDINAVDNDGKTALDYALEQGNEETILFLKENGAIANQEIN